MKATVRAIMDKPLYEFTIGVVAVFCGVNLLLQYNGSDFAHHLTIDAVIYAIFVADYFVGLWAAENKKHYLKTHIIELISIIPASALFQSARILQVIRFIQALIVFKRSMKHFYEAFARYHFISTTMIVALLVLVSGISVYLLEPDTFDGDWKNSIWWAAVTVTTVGYGDFYPVTSYGRIMAILVMVLGTAFVGLLSGILAGYYVNRRLEETDPWKQGIIKQIERLETLSPEERKQLSHMIEHYTDGKSTTQQSS